MTVISKQFEPKKSAKSKPLGDTLKLISEQNNSLLTDLFSEQLDLKNFDQQSILKELRFNISINSNIEKENLNPNTKMDQNDQEMLAKIENYIELTNCSAQELEVVENKILSESDAKNM